MLICKKTELNDTEVVGCFPKVYIIEKVSSNFDQKWREKKVKSHEAHLQRK